MSGIFRSLAFVVLFLPAVALGDERPNIVVIFIDDLGYGDLGCFGSETIRTPNIDALAQQGTRYTDFYAQVVCGPSRSALLTGRYPVRSGGWSMPADEITVAELLQDAGYRTGCIGKWDVSNRKEIVDRMPNAQGFDHFYGTLGANDNGKVTMYLNNQRRATRSDMQNLTYDFTQQAIDFMRRNREKPFFLYLSHTMVHSIIDASPSFRGRSTAGLYGDTVEELDHETGRLLHEMDQMGLAKNSLVIFTSDNGTWNNFQVRLRQKHNGEVAWGSSGPLREGKGSTYEGGSRVPCIVRWPGVVAQGATSDAIFSTLDFLPTFCAISGASVPTDRTIDGFNQLPLLRSEDPTGARSHFFYFSRHKLHGVRKGDFKLLLPNREEHYAYVKDKGTNRAELYQLSRDIGESTDLADKHPEKVKELTDLANSFQWPETIPSPDIMK